MELKVWVEGIQRIVCGVTEKTTCQDVVYALAHATGKTGRFTLIERWRNNERLLAPQEHPVKVLAKWGEYSNDVQFILQRSPLDSKSSAKGAKGAKSGTNGGGQHIKKSSTFSGQLNQIAGPNGAVSGHLQQQAAIWKSPPGVGTAPNYPKPVVSSISTGRLADIKDNLPSGLDSARLSPDSGRGSDPTGSDTSNFSDQEKAQLRGAGGAIPRTNSSHVHPPSGYQPPGAYVRSNRFTSPSPDRSQGSIDHPYSQSQGRSLSSNPPAYRPPPQPTGRNPSPADPPPYREPPPPPGSQTNAQGYGRGRPPTSPTQGRHNQRPPPHPSSINQPPHSPTPPRGASESSHAVVRPPHYSPPPHHREIRGGHLAKGPSPGRSLPSSQSGSRIQGSPARGHQTSPSRQTPNWVQRPQSGTTQDWSRINQKQAGVPKSDYSDLMNLVSAQQTRLQSQHAEIKHCDNELKYWDQINAGPGRPILPANNSSQGSSHAEHPSPNIYPGQLEAVMSEVARLEEAASHQEEELNKIDNEQSGGNIRNELDQLKHRLEMTDIELQKTNAQLRHLDGEMRNYSQEKNKQREAELREEIERIQAEIKVLQKHSEDSASVSDNLSREVKDVEAQILARKGEVEQLIQEMKSANLESLTISPPEETKAFLDDLAGPAKPGTTRKMLGSPRQLENAVPTSKNPHGVWV